MCSCVKIASLGYEGVWGPCSSDSTSAFQNWLNSQSTAHVDTYHTHASIGTITPEWLKQYNVLILQEMVDSLTVNNPGMSQSVTEGTPWQLSPAELTAIADWVKAGGGIMSMSGYNCQGSTGFNCTVVDNVATNAILSSFTDLSYNSDNTLNANPNPGQTPPCDSEDCYCWGASLPLGTATQAIATPLSTTAAASMGLAVASWNQGSPIGKNIADVGAYNGRSIKIGGSTYGTVTQDSADSQLTYAAHEQIGKGFVFAYTDEWVTYTGEWTGEASCTMGYSFDSGSCAGKSAAEVFQIPLFWYNAIKYVSGGVACFHIQGVAE
jgi:hypothetical protein